MDCMTYLDFAENDYKYFMHSYESGYVANNMAANAQNTAEKYLKHLIDQYDHDEQRLDLRTRTLRTHNLSQLMNYLSNEMNIQIPLRVKRDINALNNYYFNARYPGDNSFFVSKDDIEICKEGLDACSLYAASDLFFCNQRKAIRTNVWFKYKLSTDYA